MPLYFCRHSEQLVLVVQMRSALTNPRSVDVLAKLNCLKIKESTFNKNFLICFKYLVAKFIKLTEVQMLNNNLFTINERQIIGFHFLLRN